jgi:hypothetical protein
MILGGKDSLFDAQFPHSDLEDFEVGDLIDHGRNRAGVIVSVIGHVNAFLPEQQSTKRGAPLV